MGGLFIKPTPRQDGRPALQAIAFFTTMAHRRAPYLHSPQQFRLLHSMFKPG